MIDTDTISEESVIDEAQLKSSLLWIIVAFMPVLFQLPISGVPVWAIGLIVGWWIANKNPLRWVALAWITAVFFPTTPFLLLACSGVLIKNWRHCIYAAILGSALCLIPIPGAFTNMGTVLIILGLILVIYKRMK